MAALSQQLGTDQGTTSKAVEAALPMIIGAMANNASNDSGAQSLANALDKDHTGGDLMNNLSGFLSSTDNGAGPAILGHVFGGKQPVVEQGLSQVSGMDSSQTGQLLANLAPVVMGFLGQQKQSQGMDAAGLAGMLMGARTEASSGNNATAQMAMGMLSQFLDADNDGSIMDDVGGMLGKFFK